MTKVLDFFNQGWVGAIIALGGLSFGLYQLMRRTSARLCYQYMGQELIEGNGGLLPNQVDVTFSGRPVKRLSMTQIVVWNAGPASLRYDEIVSQDRIRFAFNGEILQAEVSRATREANLSAIDVNDANRSELFYRFSFLDKNDGILIKILHTGTSTMPKALGTIIGEPKGMKYLGRLPAQLYITRRLENPSNPYEMMLFMMVKFMRVFLWLLLLTSISAVAIAILPIIIPSLDTGISENARVPVAVTGVFYALMCFFMVWVVRRRFPPILAPDQEEKTEP